MANKQQLQIIEQGRSVWNEWRLCNREVRIDLAGADLRRLDLSGFSLRTVDLRDSNLQGVNCHGADLWWADLRGVRFSDSDLSKAKLESADLTQAEIERANLDGSILRNAKISAAQLVDANLGNADLQGANLSGADLRGANFDESTMGATTLVDLDLSSVSGLETVKHQGRSFIGLETIYRSKGNIPSIFLRGAGVPDNFIDYMGSLVGKGLEFYSCFISYSTKDSDFAERLFADLQAKGVRCWFAPHYVRAGQKLYKQIDEAIRIHERLLLILSVHSMNSEWVKTEIAKARQRELLEQKQVLFPVRLIDFDTLKNWECFDSDTGKDSAREIREYFIPDFCNWKDHSSYRENFEHLLRNLKAKPRVGDRISGE
jgi:uncharacterized protein YjbI with pentapeptide repeats